MAIGESTTTTAQGASGGASSTGTGSTATGSTGQGSTGMGSSGTGSTGPGSTGMGGTGTGQNGPGIGDELRQRASTAGQRLSDVTHERMREAFEERQGVVAERISGFAHALRSAADQMRSEDQPGTATYVHQAAEQVDRFASNLQQYGFDDLLMRAERMARRQPELYVGGALLVGVALGRFLRASGERRNRRTGYSSYGSDEAGSYSAADTYGGRSSGYAGARGQTYNPTQGDDYGSGGSGLYGTGWRSRNPGTRAGDADHFPNAMGAGAGGLGTARGGQGAGGLGDMGSGTRSGMAGATSGGYGSRTEGAAGTTGTAGTLSGDRVTGSSVQSGTTQTKTATSGTPTSGTSTGGAAGGATVAGGERP